MYRAFATLTSCVVVTMTAAMAQTPGGTPTTGVPNPANPPPIVNADATRTPAAGSTALNGSTDELFIQTMANGGLAEVEAGKLASVRAADPEVKKFGQTMVADHAKSHQKLKALAETRKLDLPTAPDAEKKAETAKLEAQRGPAFDAAYMHAMVKAHQKTVALLEEQIQHGKDATVRHFAQETLPTVKHHLEIAQQLQAKVSHTAEPRAARQ